jgi:hypothetical protein
VDDAHRNVTELQGPAADVRPVRVERLALERRVNDAGVGGGVGPGVGSPLPAAIVAGPLAVDEFLHERGLAATPVDQQVLDQE